MVLSMPSPYKHPETGVYWYRQRVPARLVTSAKGKTVTVTIDGRPSRPKIGADIKVTLATKMPAIAKQRAHEAQSEFDRVWLSFESGPVSLSQRQCVALSGQMYHVIREVLEDNPGTASEWAERRREREARAALPPPRYPALMIHPPKTLLERLGTWVDGSLAEYQLTVDEKTYQRLLIEFDRAAGDIAELLERRANGDYGPDAMGARFPAFELERGLPRLPQASGVTLTQLVDIWAGRLDKPKAQTVKAYRSIINKFIVFLGHDDAGQVTDMDILRWHEELVRPETVTHDTFIKRYRAAISTVYAYSMTPKGRMAVGELGNSAPTSNPAAGLKLEGQSKVTNRPLFFTTEEANKILWATLQAPTAINDFSDYNRNAQRWVPWLCAYTGARAGELCQLRRRDFVEIDGIKCVALLPDAGTIKTGKFRYVPLHPTLLDQGIWDFVTETQGETIFYSPGLTSDQPWVQTVQMLGEWVRTTAKVTDARIGPNHAWRHWFKTKGRTANIADTYLDVICGHAPATQGGKYGEFEPAALLRELLKLPIVTPTPPDSVQS